MTLAQARAAAKELKATITLGADPRGEAKAQKQVSKFSTFFENDYPAVLEGMKMGKYGSLRPERITIFQSTQDGRMLL